VFKIGVRTDLVREQFKEWNKMFHILPSQVSGSSNEPGIWNKQVWPPFIYYSVERRIKIL
jgi:hypothetical protein